MASLGTVFLLVLPLVTLYFNFAVSEERMLGKQCNTSADCQDDILFCLDVCKCNDTHYQESKSSCKPRISPNNICGNSSTDKNETCVDNAYCNASNVCVCGINFSSTSCLEASHTDSSVFTVQTTVPKYTKDNPHGNSAETIAVVEISAYILCFMLAYFNVPN